MFGRPLTNDSFNVAGETISNNITSSADADIVLERSVESRSVAVNNSNVFGTGFETLRLVTLGGTDTILDPGALALVVNLWDPRNDD